VVAATLGELGDVTRFDNPRQLMAYIGLLQQEALPKPIRDCEVVIEIGVARAHARGTVTG